MGRKNLAIRLLAAACGLVLTSGCSVFENLEREGTLGSAESVRLSMGFHPAEAGEDLPKQLEGSFEAEIVEGGKRAHLSVDIDSLPKSVPGPDLEFIFVQGGPAYVRFLDEKSLSKRKTWLRVEPSRLVLIAPWVEQYVDFLTDDRFLEGKSFDEDDQVGSGTVRGVETTIYSLSLDVEEMAELGLSEQQVAQIRRMVGDEAHFKIWLDDEGFLRRMEMPTFIPRFDEILLRIELYDYDGDFEVSIPPDSEVTGG